MADLDEAARMAALAGLSGGVARVLMALHGGVRSLPILTLEGCLGCMIGIMAAAGVVYLDPSLRHDGWPLLIVGGAAGAAGAIGTRLLDIVTAAIQRRIGYQRPYSHPAPRRVRAALSHPGDWQWTPSSCSARC